MSDSFETSPGDQRLSVRITSSIVGSTVAVSKPEHETRPAGDGVLTANQSLVAV
jgi:hypothetical protein